MGFSTLQDAVDASQPGDTLQLVGTCKGQTTFTHTVAVIGPGVLDGGGITPVIVPQGVFVLMGDLSITNGRGMLGGGVHNDGLLALDHTTVSGNHANDAGGGIYNSGGLEISDSCSITNNTSDGDGGGIDNSATGNALVSQCDISGNSANLGGGVANEGGTFELNQATIDGNTAALWRRNLDVRRQRHPTKRIRYHRQHRDRQPPAQRRRRVPTIWDADNQRHKHRHGQQPDRHPPLDQHHVNV